MSASRFRWRRDFANRSNAATLALTITVSCTVAATDENKVNIYCHRRGGWETAVLYTATRDRTTPIPSSRARQEMRDRSIGFSSLVPAASQLLEMLSHMCTYVRCSTRAFCCVYVCRRIVHRELSFSRIVEYILFTIMYCLCLFSSSISSIVKALLALYSTSCFQTETGYKFKVIVKVLRAKHNVSFSDEYLRWCGERYFL